MTRTNVTKTTVKPAYAGPIENRIVKHRSCEQPEHVGMSVCCQW